MSVIFFYQAIDSGLDVNTRHSLGWTALQTAAINGRVEALRYLIERGADINAGDNFVNVYKTAMEKRMHPSDGKITSIYKYNYFSLYIIYNSDYYAQF